MLPIYRTQMSISIHTPAQGVTEFLPVPEFLHFHFNPHSRTGSDYVSPNLAVFPYISIHTPAQGVTGYFAFGQQFDRFQSTLPHRE